MVAFRCTSAANLAQEANALPGTQSTPETRYLEIVPENLSWKNACGTQSLQRDKKRQQDLGKKQRSKIPMGFWIIDVPPDVNK